MASPDSTPSGSGVGPSVFHPSIEDCRRSAAGSVLTVTTPYVVLCERCRSSLTCTSTPGTRARRAATWRHSLHQRQTETPTAATSLPRPSTTVNTRPPHEVQRTCIRLSVSSDLQDIGMSFTGSPTAKCRPTRNGHSAASPWNAIRCFRQPSPTTTKRPAQSGGGSNQLPPICKKLFV